jgi:dienelactone hydrolase
MQDTSGGGMQRRCLATLRRARTACVVLAILAGLPQPLCAAGHTPVIEEVAFDSAGVVLSGTLHRATQPFAAVVIVHGSGQEQRMSDFAALLAQRGITALTYDKRGVGRSGGVYAGPEVGTNNIDAANLALLAADAAAAVRTLADRIAAQPGKIGLLGFSQAGWIVPIAAKQAPTVQFMVLFSGPVVTAREQLRFQFMTSGQPGFWDTHTEAAMRERLRTEPDRYQFADTDPRDSLAQLAIPGLWLFGGRDLQLPVQLSIERLQALDDTGARFEYRLFPALDHNTAFAASSEPVDQSVQWMRSVSMSPGRRPPSRASSEPTAR